jgi:hypothetical protein
MRNINCKPHWLAIYCMSRIFYFWKCHQSDGESTWRTVLKDDHPRTISTKFGEMSNGFQEYFQTFLYRTTLSGAELFSLPEPNDHLNYCYPFVSVFCCPNLLCGVMVGMLALRVWNARCMYTLSNDLMGKDLFIKSLNIHDIGSFVCDQQCDFFQFSHIARVMENKWKMSF